MHIPWGRDTVPFDEVGTLKLAEEGTALLVAVDGKHTPEYAPTLLLLSAGGALTPEGAVTVLFFKACGTHSTGGEDLSAPLVGAGGMFVATAGAAIGQ